jgi:hypothetical protein
MNEIIAALVAATSVLAGILFEKLFLLATEREKRAKEFFQDFFPERLQAHKEIIRVITKCGINYLEPERLGWPAIKIALEDARQRIEAVFFETLLAAERHVSGNLLGLSPLITKILETDPHFEEEDFLRDALEQLKAQNNELVKLLREKSGVDIIDREFDKALKDGGNVVKKEKKKFGKRIQGKKKRPC